MSIGLKPLKYIKKWLNKTTVKPEDWDEIANKTSTWANTLNLNLTQIGLDIAGNSYVFNNNGLRSLSNSITSRLGAVEYTLGSSVNTNMTVSISGTVATTILADGSVITIDNPGYIQTSTGIYQVTEPLEVDFTSDTFGDTSGGGRYYCFYIMVINETVPLGLGADITSSVGVGVSLIDRLEYLDGNTNAHVYFYSNATTVTSGDGFKTSFPNTYPTALGSPDFFYEGVVVKRAYGSWVAIDNQNSLVSSDDYSIPNRASTIPITFRTIRDTFSSGLFKSYTSIDSQLLVRASYSDTILKVQAHDDGVNSYDTYLLFDVNNAGTRHSIGLDNSTASDLLTFSNGTVLGTNNYLTILATTATATNQFTFTNWKTTSGAHTQIQCLAGSATSGKASFLAGSTTWSWEFGAAPSDSNQAFRISKTSLSTSDMSTSPFWFTQSGSSGTNAFHVGNTGGTVSSSAFNLYYDSDNNSKKCQITFYDNLDVRNWNVGINTTDESLDICRSRTASSNIIAKYVWGGSGALNSLVVQNSNNIANSSSALRLVVAGTTASDPYSEWSNGTNYMRLGWNNNSSWGANTQALAICRDESLNFNNLVTPSPTHGNITFLIAGSGGNNRISINNQNNTSGSAAQLQLVVGGSSSGDASISFRNIDSGRNQWIMGADTSANTFVLSNSSTLGTTNVFSISATTITLNEATVISSASTSGLDITNTGQNGLVITNTGTPAIVSTGAKISATGVTGSAAVGAQITVSPSSTSFDGSALYIIDPGSTLTTTNFNLIEMPASLMETTAMGAYYGKIRIRIDSSYYVIPVYQV